MMPLETVDYAETIRQLRAERDDLRRQLTVATGATARMATPDWHGILLTVPDATIVAKFLNREDAERWAKGQYDDWEYKIVTIAQAVSPLKELAQARAEVERLRKALAWYADITNYEPQADAHGRRQRPIMVHKWRHAAAALRADAPARPEGE